jgi:hypothetical protein
MQECDVVGEPCGSCGTGICALACPAVINLHVCVEGSSSLAPCDPSDPFNCVYAFPGEEDECVAASGTCGFNGLGYCATHCE